MVEDRQVSFTNPAQQFGPAVHDVDLRDVAGNDEPRRTNDLAMVQPDRVYPDGRDRPNSIAQLSKFFA